MPWYDWPWAGEYTPDTHVTDRVTPVDPKAIYSGLARDVANIQHHINTTYLIASGYAHPVLSGWFDNIDTNNLYVENLHTRNITFNELKAAANNIQKVIFNSDTTELFLYDCAIRDYNIPISDRFMTDSRFEISPSGLYFNGVSISGSVFPYLLASGESSWFQGIDIRERLTLDGCYLVLANPYQDYIMVENMSTIHISGQMTEDKIDWYSFGGHDHKRTPIDVNNILEDDLHFTIAAKFESPQSAIVLTSGILDAATYDVGIYDELESFVEVPVSSGAYYLDESNTGISGSIRDLDLGVYCIETWGDQIYASSDISPNGLITTHSGVATTYIYTTDNFYHWNAIPMSGLISTSGSYVRGMCTWIDDIWIMTENRQYSGKSDIMVQKLGDRNDATKHYWLEGGTISCHDTASPYPHGMTLTNNTLYIYGYTGDHYTSGVPRWDAVGYSGTLAYPTTAQGIDSSLSGVPYVYTKPLLLEKTINTTNYSFVDCHSGSGLIDASYGIAPYLEPSGQFVDLFGNGMNEITSLLSYCGRLNRGKGRYCTQNLIQGVKVGRIVKEFNDILYDNKLIVLGNAYAFIRTTTGNGIFGGNMPIMNEIASHSSLLSYLYPRFGDSTYRIPLGYGGRSLMDDQYIIHIDVSGYQNLFSESVDILPTYDNLGQWCWHDAASDNEAFVIGRNPTVASVLNSPFCEPERLAYQNYEESTPTPITFTTASPINNAGILITSGTFTASRGMPTYYDRTTFTGLWGDKQFNWHYFGDPGLYGPPSGNLSPTYYYMQPISPISYNGVIYCALKYNTGFIYIGCAGPEYVDDGVMYTSLCLYEGQVYGIGCEVSFDPFLKLLVGGTSGIFKYNLTIRRLCGRESIKLTLPISGRDTYKQYKLFVYRGRLYASVGQGRFLVQNPSHSKRTQIRIN